MIVRTPLVPWIIASQSISRSQTCQNGDAHLPATKPKSIAETPSPATRLTNRCPKIRTMRITPDARMNTQP